MLAVGFGEISAQGPHHPAGRDRADRIRDQFDDPSKTAKIGLWWLRRPAMRCAHQTVGVQSLRLLSQLYHKHQDSLSGRHGTAQGRHRDGAGGKTWRRERQKRGAMGAPVL